MCFLCVVWVVRVGYVVAFGLVAASMAYTAYKVGGGLDGWDWMVGVCEWVGGLVWRGGGSQLLLARSLLMHPTYKVGGDLVGWDWLVAVNGFWGAGNKGKEEGRGCQLVASWLVCTRRLTVRWLLYVCACAGRAVVRGDGHVDQRAEPHQVPGLRGAV